MHILMISDVYFPRVNGVSTSIKTFRDELIKKGHKVTLIVPDYPDQNYTDDKDIIRIKSKKVLLDPEDRLMSKSAIKSLGHKLGLKNIDVIHIHTPFVAHYSGSWLAHALDVPCVESYHTFFEEYLYHYIRFLPHRWLKTAARWFSRSQCNSVDRLVVPSSAMYNVLKEYGVKAVTGIIPTGIHSDKFSLGEGSRFRIKYSIDKDRPVMLYLGRVAHEKNIEFLLYVLEEVKKHVESILMVIAGNGPAVESLKALAEQLDLNDNVMFIGYLSREQELPDCYAAANVFTFASRTETQGLVLLEAMAAGTAVVSTAIMGTADVLKDNHGALIAEEDISIFSKKVIRILLNPETELLLEQSARQYAAEWSVERFTNKLCFLYENVIIEKTEEPFASGNMLHDLDA